MNTTKNATVLTYNFMKSFNS